MTQSPSPLRARMIEDMTIRRFGDKTQKQYVRHIKNFTSFFRLSAGPGLR